MIDTLKNMTSVIPDTLLASVKQSTHQRHPVFTYALSSQANSPISSRQSIIWTTYTGSENGFTENGKLTKALSDPPIFTNRKELSVDQ